MDYVVSVSVYDLHCGSADQLWEVFVSSLKTSTFIALDLELSGLGNRKLINGKSVPDRFKAISDAAKSRAIISIGVSCFTLNSSRINNGTHYSVKTFNVPLLCSNSYVVEPEALSFLVQHGFDFNQQYLLGIPYYPGEDKKEDGMNINGRQIMTELIKCRKPLVLHNALVDLVFLHQHLYTELPSSVETFLAQFSEMFPQGIFDTKYIAENHARTNASYLEYIFKKALRENYQVMQEKPSGVHLHFEELLVDSKYVEWLSCGCSSSTVGEEVEGCKNFAAHGWCSNGVLCPRSHDVDYIIDNEEKIMSSKRKRTKQRIRDPEKRLQMKKEKLLEKVEKLESLAIQSENHTTQVSVENVTHNSVDISKPKPVLNLHTSPAKDKSTSTESKAGGHKAGFDSFMTGFSFAFYIDKFGDVTVANFAMLQLQNKIALSGKDIPLIIQKSSFTKVSKQHMDKLSKLSLSTEHQT